MEAGVAVTPHVDVSNCLHTLNLYVTCVTNYIINYVMIFLSTM